MKDLRTWLDSDRNYAEGCQLYELHGSSDALKILFRMGDKPLTRTKLAAALQEILNSHIPVPAPTDEHARAGHFPSDHDNAPEALKLLIQERIQLYGHVQRLHAVLQHMAITEPEKFSDAQRGVKANELLKTWDQINNIWYRTSYYDRKGYLPEPIPTVQIILQPGELALRALMNERSKLSKCKKGRLKLDIPTIEARIIELERILEEEQ